LPSGLPGGPIVRGFVGILNDMNPGSITQTKETNNKYVFIDLHEIFFHDFPHLLQEWILRLMDNHPMNRIRQIYWTLVQIQQLQQVNNKFTSAVNFWLESIVAGFIIEFVVDTTNSYNTTEKEFL
jgi:hypothetical protein